MTKKKAQDAVLPFVGAASGTSPERDRDSETAAPNGPRTSLVPLSRSLNMFLRPGLRADLAARGVVGIYPVSGWWKDQPKRDRSAMGARYALIVSIETPPVNTDIWTPVALQVGLPIAVAP